MVVILGSPLVCSPASHGDLFPLGVVTSGLDGCSSHVKGSLSATVRVEAMVYISGSGIGRSQRPNEMSLNDLVYEATVAALADAHLTRQDIDLVCLGASDQLDGRAISSMLLAAPAGGYLMDEVKISEEGTLALATAALALQAGVAERALVVSWTKASESPPDRARGVNPEPIFTRPAGLHPTAVEAMVCGEFATRHDVSLAEIDALAQHLSARTIENEIVAWPLRTIHIPPPTDAAVAVVLTADGPGMELSSWAWRVDHHNPVERNAPPEVSLAALAGQVLADAGTAASSSAVIETTDRNAFRLCISMAGLGVVEPAEAPSAILEGKLPNLNRSGGLWSSNPIVAAGLERFVGATDILRSGTADTAIVHSSFGVGGQGDFVAVVRG